MTQRLPPSTPIPAIPGATLGDFWSWGFSDHLSNTVRPMLAEWLVGVALDCLSETRVEWDAVDHVYRGKKVEVKSAGYVQSWAQEKPSAISFGIPLKKGWDSVTNTSPSIPMRSADVYVFAVQAEKDRERVNSIDLDQWKFYVLTTTVLNDTFGEQKSVVLSRIETLGQAVSFEGLRGAVDRALGLDAT